MSTTTTMMMTLPSRTEMFNATLARDGSYDGVFFVCVRTTGIFCRPSCPAKKPQEKNITFRASVRDCLLDGFCPCKRCRPLATQGQAPGWLNRVIDQVEELPTGRLTDGHLRSLGVDPHRARRYFKHHFGMTFHAYHRARRMGLALNYLLQGRDQLEVSMECGFESPSGFRDAFERTFGTSPGKSHEVRCIRTMRVESPVGPLVAGATDDAVCLLEFADRRAFERQVTALRKRLDAAVIPGSNPILDQLEKELAAYFDGRLTEFTVPLSFAGTPFQEQVWRALREIPFGATTSYEELARSIGRAGSQRAVGRANGDNRIAVLIPCHRVVRRDGTLCGYGGGLWRKQHLLDLEKRVSQSAKGVNERESKSLIAVGQLLL